MRPFNVLFDTQESVNGAMVVSVAITVHAPSFMEAVQTVYEYCRTHNIEHSQIVHVVDQELARH